MRYNVNGSRRNKIRVSVNSKNSIKKVIVSASSVETRVFNPYEQYLGYDITPKEFVKMLKEDGFLSEKIIKGQLIYNFERIYTSISGPNDTISDLQKKLLNNGKKNIRASRQRNLTREMAQEVCWPNFGFRRISVLPVRANIKFSNDQKKDRASYRNNKAIINKGNHLRSFSKIKVIDSSKIHDDSDFISCNMQGTFGESLDAYMINKNISNCELAIKSRVSEGTIRNYRNGTVRSIPFKTALSILAGLEASSTILSALIEKVGAFYEFGKNYYKKAFIIALIYKGASKGFEFWQLNLLEIDINLNEK